jgi:CBS domain-containing protein
MRQSVRLGRVDGIPVGVHWSVFVIMLLLVQGLAMTILPTGGRVLAAVLWWVGGDRAAAGWFLTAAARAETTDVTLRDTLAGVRVGEVMTAPAVCGYASQSVTDSVTTVARYSPHHTFPVLDLDGRLVGVVTLTGLAKVPVPDRDTVRLGRAMVPVNRIHVLDPATLLVDAASMLLAGGHRLAPVAPGNRLSGVITTADITHAIELAALNTRPATGDQPATPAPRRPACHGNPGPGESPFRRLRNKGGERRRGTGRTVFVHGWGGGPPTARAPLGPCRCPVGPWSLGARVGRC